MSKELSYMNPMELITNPYRTKLGISKIDMEEQRFLKESIAKDGIREPIITNEQLVILDGHDRRDIAVELNLKVVAVEIVKLSEKEQKMLFIERTMDRKHLPISMRAMLAAEYDSLKTGRPKKETPDPILIREDLANKFGISEKTLTRARIIKQSTKIPEVLKAKVSEGKLPIATVAELDNKSQVVIDKITKKIEDGKTISRAIAEAEGTVKTFKTESLPFRQAHIALIKAHIKTQTSRQRSPEELNVGDIIRADLYEPSQAKLKITSMLKKNLSEFTIEDAHREGYDSLEKFKEVWKEINGKWNDNQTVSVIQFEVV